MLVPVLMVGTKTSFANVLNVTQLALKFTGQSWAGSCAVGESNADFSPFTPQMLFLSLYPEKYIGFQILNFTRLEEGIRVRRTGRTSSRIPTDNAVKFNI